MAASAASGSRTSALRAIIDAPIAQMTCRNDRNVKSTLNQMRSRNSVSSSTTSQRPRVNRNHDTSPGVAPRRRRRPTPSPARSAKVGAQRCVTQRVA
jgi:hypothetical protein